MAALYTPNVLALHYIGLIAGVAALLIILLDIRILWNTNWNVFTSRIFLKKDASMPTIARISYLLSFAILALAASHFLTIKQAPIAASISHVLATTSLVAAMIIAYRLKRELAQKSGNTQ